MGYVNAQIIVGRLGTDPDLRVEAGVPVCRFPVGTTQVYKKGGDMIRETEWHRVVIVGPKAHDAAKALRKGGEVYVKGPKRTSAYSDHTNVARTRVEIHASEIVWPGMGKPGEFSPNVQGMPSHIVIGEAPEGEVPGNVEVQTGIRIENLADGILTPGGGVARSNAPGSNNRQGGNRAGNAGMQLNFTDDEDDYVSGFTNTPVDELSELEDLSARVGTGQDTFWGRGAKSQPSA